MPNLGEIRRGKYIGYASIYQNYIWHACVDCGKERWVQFRKGKPLNLRCYSCAKWKGGQTSYNGYTLLYRPNHPRANSWGYVKRAILVLEEKLNRPILLGMDSHHKNEVRDDDRPENLEELTRSKHRALHNRLFYHPI